MKVTPRFQAAAGYPEMLRTYGSQPDAFSFAGSADSFADAMFQELLEDELGNLQRVVSAEEILADLDGTPTFQYNGIPADEPYNGPNARETGASRTGKPNSETLRSIYEKINKIAQSYGVDPNLVTEVVRAESNFNPNAVSRAGAKGLMQLMDGTARMLRVRDVYDPEQNIAGGTKYLRDLLNRYNGNVKVALAAYNAGPGRIKQLGIDTDEELEAKAELLPQETQRYVAKITSRLGHYE
jgi:hypothetical protein